MDLHILQLEPLKYLLVNKYYDRFKVKGRAKSHDDVWVGYVNNQLVAACRIQYITHHLFLSTLFVDPMHQGVGYGKRLIQKITSFYQEDIYLFAGVDLVNFYSSVSFFEVYNLPDELTNIFDIYQKHNMYLRPFLFTSRLLK